MQIAYLGVQYRLPSTLEQDYYRQNKSGIPLRNAALFIEISQNKVYVIANDSNNSIALRSRYLNGISVVRPQNCI